MFRINHSVHHYKDGRVIVLVLYNEFHRDHFCEVIRHIDEEYCVYIYIHGVETWLCITKYTVRKKLRVNVKCIKWVNVIILYIYIAILSLCFIRWSCDVKVLLLFIDMNFVTSINIKKNYRYFCSLSFI